MCLITVFFVFIYAAQIINGKSGGGLKKKRRKQKKAGDDADQKDTEIKAKGNGDSFEGAW